MEKLVRFDESLTVLIGVLKQHVASNLVDGAVFLRDVSGRLSVVIDEEIKPDKLALLEKSVSEKLGAYARAEYSVRDRTGPGAERLLEEGANIVPIEINGTRLKLLDRRIVGSDWLTPPASPLDVPCVAFASLKGGVGRSTALAVVASHLSTRGLRVLVVDLDLEAPGIGTMLLSTQALPRFGTLDYLVENGLSGIDQTFIRDMTAKSSLGAIGGQVTVLPAIGSATVAHPASALAKIARAYLDDPGEQGAISLASQVREMVQKFSSTSDFDVVLIDGRAGLHESTAGILLALGAEVLLFGIDEPQTFLGYRLLLSHLAQYKSEAYDLWSQRIAFVNAKAPADIEARADAAVRFGDLAALFQLKESPALQPGAPLALTVDDFELDWVASSDDFQPFDVDFDSWPVIHVSDDSRYHSFDPIKQQSLLTSDLYRATFGELIDYVEGLIPTLEIEDAGV